MIKNNLLAELSKNFGLRIIKLTSFFVKNGKNMSSPVRSINLGQVLAQTLQKANMPKQSQTSSLNSP